MTSMKKLIIFLLPLCLLASDPVVRNEYLDTSTGLWLVEGSCGYIVCKSCDMSYTMSFAIPIGFSIFKEIYVDTYKNDLFGLWDQPDVIGFDPADISFSIIGTMIGFIVSELWDHRINLSLNNNGFKLSYHLGET